MLNIYVDENEVEKAINTLNPEKPVGSDGIPAKFYKMFSSPLSKPLHHIIRQSLVHSEYPDLLKEAYITPVYKGKGPKNQPSSYRPISNLSATAKIIDHLVYTRVMNYFDATNQISKYQHGFRFDHSTQSAVIELTNKIYSAGDTGLYTGVLFVDFQQAFDFVLRDLIIQKLMMYGIRGKLLAWFYSYLTNRTCRVKVEGTLSCKYKLRGFLPQGGKLSSLLFIIFINDLPDFLKRCIAFLYADDIALCYSAKSNEEVYQAIQEDTDQIIKWCSENQMRLNASKTKFMMFHPRRNPSTESESETSHIIIDDQKIENVSSFKYLGVWLDPKLTWNEHFDVVNRKVSVRSNLINRNKKYFQFDDLKLIYDSLVLSVVNYCLPIWGNICKTKIIKLDRKIILMASSVLHNTICKRRDNLNVLEKLNWLSVNERREISTCEFIFKHVIKNSSLSATLQINYKKPPDIRQRRNSENFVQPNYRTIWARSSFLYQSIKLWNQIPNPIQCNRSLSAFTRELRQHIIHRRSDIYVYTNK